MKKIKLKESDLVNLIEKLVKENFAQGAANGNGQNLGIFGTPTSKYKDLLEKEDVEEKDDMDEMEMDEMETKEGHKGYKKIDHSDRDEFDGRKSRVVGVDSDINLQRMGESKKKTLKLTESQLISIIEKVVKEKNK